MKKFFCTFNGETREIENPSLCSFGFFEVVLPTALAAVSSTIAAGATALGTTAGIGAATAAGIGDVVGTVGTGALVGGALGAATDWKQPLKGAEYGAITGAGIAAGPALGGALGIGAIGGDVLAGGAAGALGGLATGRGAGMGALEGAGAGLVSGGIGALSQVGSPLAPTGGGSAAGAAAPGSVPLSGPEAVNVTPQVQLGSAPSSVGANLPGAVGQGAASGIPTSTTGIQPATTGLPGAGAAAGGAAPAAAPSLTSALPQAAASPAPAPAVAGSDLTSNILNAPAGSSLASAGVGPVTTAASNTAEATNVIGDSASIGATPGASPGMFDSLGQFAKSPSGIASTLGMVGSVIKGNMKPPGFSELQSQAGQLSQQGSLLKSYMQTGQLPPGMQHALDTAANSARATVRSQYANSGMSGSSAEAQDVQSVADHEAAQAVQITENLFNAGVQESQLGAEMYMSLMKIQMEQDTNLSNAVGNFVTSFANMGRPLPAQGSTGGG